MKKYNAKLAAVDIAECSLFVVLMVAGVYIKIPIPVMPITFQTVFAVLSGLLLGRKKGMIAMTAYAVMGLIGIPVFTEGGGIFYVMKVSFGYILGFIASAGIAGTFYGRDCKLWVMTVISLAATLADYAVGIAYFVAAWKIMGNANLWASVVAYNLVYIPKDALLAVLAALLAKAVAPRIAKMHKKAKSVNG